MVLVSGTRKKDHCMTQLVSAELHWLDVADRVMHTSLHDGAKVSSQPSARLPV